MVRKLVVDEWIGGNGDRKASIYTERGYGPTKIYHSSGGPFTPASIGEDVDTFTYKVVVPENVKEDVNKEYLSKNKGCLFFWWPF